MVHVSTNQYGVASIDFQQVKYPINEGSVRSLIATILLILSYVVFWVAYFMPNKKYYLLINLCSAILTLVWFVVIQRYDGLANHLVGMLRDVLVLVVPKKYRHIVAAVVFVLATVSIGYTWSGWSSLVVLLVAYTGVIINVYAEMSLLRVLAGTRAVLYSMYLFLCGQYTGIALELGDTVVCLIAQRYYKRKARKENVNEV